MELTCMHYAHAKVSDQCQQRCAALQLCHYQVFFSPNTVISAVKAEVQ